MDAQPFHRLERECWRPARAGRVAPLLLEIVAAIARGRQRQVVWTLPPHVGAEARSGDGVVQQAAPQRPFIAHGDCIVARAGVGRGRLGIEVIEPGVIQPLRSHVNRRCNELLIRLDPIHLRERIDSLVLFLVERERKRVYLHLAHFVFQPFGKEEFVAHDGPFRVQTRRGIADAAHAPTADDEIGEGVVEFPLPLIAAAARFHRNQSGGEAPIFGYEWRLIHRHRLHAIDGHGEPELPCRRVGDIGRVDDERTAMLGAARDFKAAIRLAHHARNHGQSVGNSGRTAGQFLDLLGGQTGRYG